MNKLLTFSLIILFARSLQGQELAKSINTIPLGKQKIGAVQSLGYAQKKPNIESDTSLLYKQVYFGGYLIDSLWLQFDKQTYTLNYVDMVFLGGLETLITHSMLTANKPFSWFRYINLDRQAIYQDLYSMMDSYVEKSYLLYQKSKKMKDISNITTTKADSTMQAAGYIIIDNNKVNRVETLEATINKDKTIAESKTTLSLECSDLSKKNFITVFDAANTSKQQTISRSFKIDYIDEQSKYARLYVEMDNSNYPTIQFQSQDEYQKIVFNLSQQKVSLSIQFINK